MLFAPRRVRFEQDVITRVVRVLPGQGKLNVVLGQEVTPEEIIGSCVVSLGFRTINLATALSISAKDVKKYLRKQLGQRIYKGELLAYKKGGFFHSEKVVVSPTDGILDFLNSSTGELRMSFLPRRDNLTSGVYGIVEEIVEEKGFVLIKTQVSKVFGVFGVGKGRDGLLVTIGGKNDLVNVAKISVKDAEHILLCGSLIYKEAIAAAISAGIHGIISGGLNAEDFRSMTGGRLSFPRKLDSDIGITIVCCEGFGTIPIGNDIYEILSKFEGKFVSIDGNRAVLNLPSFSSSSMKKIRSIGLPKNISSPILSEDAPLVEIKEGQKIRIVGSSYRGQQGQVIAQDKSKTLLPSGIGAFLVTIETKSRKIQMPSTNIEVIG